MGDSVGTLKTDVICNSGGFVSGMNQCASATQKGVTTIRASLGSLTSIASQSGGLIPGQFGGLLGTLMNPGTMGLGAAGAAFAFVQKSAREAKQTLLDSSKLGMGVVGYQELAFAARKSGTSIEEVAGPMQRMRKQIAESAKAGGKGAAVFRDLGINAKDLANLDTDQAFEKIAKSVMAIQSPLERARVEMELFGKSGASLEPLLQKAAGGLDKFRGHTLSKQQLMALQRQKLNFGEDIPLLGKKSVAGFTQWTESIGHDVGAGHYWSAFKRYLTFGHNHGDGSYEKEMKTVEQLEDDKRRLGSQAEASEQGPRAFGELAMQGTQAAYEATTAWKYGLDDGKEEQTELLRQIADNTSSGGGSNF